MSSSILVTGASGFLIAHYSCCAILWRRHYLLLIPTLSRLAFALSSGVPVMLRGARYPEDPAQVRCLSATCGTRLIMSPALFHTLTLDDRF
jgi:hypothetical protein